MSKYHVYAMGNALLDSEFHVTDDFLNQNNIEKNAMTLIDQKQRQQLLAKLNQIKPRYACGGSGANTAIAVSQFGGEVFYSCKIADDNLGNIYYQDLLNWQVNTNANDTNRETGHTGQCFVMVTPDAERTMNSYLGITQDFSKNELVSEEIKQADYLFIEGYLVASPSAFDAISHAQKVAREAGVRIALTLSDVSIIRFFKENMLKIISEEKVELIFCNQQEAFLFAETDNITDAANYLKRYANKFIITQDANGSYLYDGEKYHDLDAYPTNKIDALGAGDLYAGAFLYAITHGYNDVNAAKIADLAAAKVVSKMGPRLDKHEVEEVKQLIDKLIEK